MLGIKPKKPLRFAKCHYRDNNGRQHVLSMEITKASKDSFIVKHPWDGKKSHTLLESDSFYTRKKWNQFRTPMWVRTWLVKEGVNGSINVNGTVSAAGLSDVQQNIMLHTKVIEEFLLADLLSQMVSRLEKLLILCAILIVVVGLVSAYDVTLDDSTKAAANEILKLLTPGNR